MAEEGAGLHGAAWFWVRCFWFRGFSGSGASAMRIYWLALAVLYCKIGGSGVTVPRRRPGRLLVSQVSASAM